MRLEIRDFRLVVAITELGTLTRAGHQLNLTQSALSHQLADLERRLGASLFERSGRRMIPNRLGARLASHGKELLQRLGDVERDVFDAAARREAVLRIATECYTCYHWLPPVLHEFRA
jgi:LysR family transcriptional regulator for metE and metH